MKLTLLSLCFNFIKYYHFLLVSFQAFLLTILAHSDRDKLWKLKKIESRMVTFCQPSNLFFFHVNSESEK